MTTPTRTSPSEIPRQGWQRLLVAGRGRTWAAALALLCCFSLLLPEPGPLPGLRNQGFDAYQKLWPRVRTAQPVVIVAIDDRSLARVGQWPWPRDTMARLVDRIAARKPAVTGIDIVFAEPDRTSPDFLAQRFSQSDPPMADRLRQLPSNDALLAAALSRSPVVLGVVGNDKSGSEGEGFAPARIVGAAPRLDTFLKGERSLPEIDGAAAGRGIFNAPLDNGVVRRVPLVATVAGYPLLSMPLECLRVAAGEPVFSLVSEPSAPLKIVIGDLALPTQPDGSAFVHYAGHDSNRYVSAVDVLEGRDDPDLIAGRIALVGVVGEGLVDYQLTPNGERLPGVEVHAEVIENIFSNSLLHRPEAARGIETACFALLALMAVAWMPRLSPLQSALAYIASGVVLLGGGVAAYLWQRQLFDPLTPLAGLTAVHAILVLAAWMMIEIERKRLSAHLAIEREASARTAGELEAARRIQTGMLPRPEKVLANEKRVQLFAHMRPAREVGGDLYDFFYLDQRRLFAVVGDVAGKGLAAALFMAVSKALTKSTSLRGPSSLGDLMELINIELVRDNPDELFVTLLAVVLDLDSGQIEYCNAGHEPLLQVRADGSVQVLDEGGGPPLCVFDYIGYTSVRHTLQPGEWLALVSDGFTEAMSSDGNLWGRDAMKSALQSACTRDGNVTASGADVLSRLARFEAGVDPTDDQTMLLLRWLGRPAQTNAAPA